MGKLDKLIKQETGESDYHSIDKYSYSRLAAFEKDKWDYYMRFVLKDEDYILAKRKAMKDSPDIKMGNLFDVLLTDADSYESKYFEGTLTNIPTAGTQMFVFVNFLFDNRIEFPDIVENFQKSFEDLKEWNGGKVQSKFETFIDKFHKEGEEYFDHLVASNGKIIISVEEHAKVTKAVEMASTATQFYNKGDKYTKFPIFFEYMYKEFKAEIDEFVVDHDKKEIQLIDWKTTYDPEIFIYHHYLKLKTYIQAGLYKKGFELYIQNTDFKGYKVLPMQFKVVDINGFKAPLLYTTSELNYHQAFNGFTTSSGNHYKGIDQIISEIDVSIENNIWNQSILNYNNGGVVQIPSFATVE